MDLFVFWTYWTYFSMDVFLGRLVVFIRQLLLFKIIVRNEDEGLDSSSGAVEDVSRGSYV